MTCSVPGGNGAAGRAVGTSRGAAGQLPGLEMGKRWGSPGMGASGGPPSPHLCHPPQCLPEASAHQAILPLWLVFTKHLA